MSRHKKPAPVYSGPILKPTIEEIHAAKNGPGGWTKWTLGSWGVPWPPPAGWLAKLEAQAMREASVHTLPIRHSNRRSVTLFADGSWKEGVAGFGAWIKGPGMPVGMSFGGPVEREIEGHMEAEMMALTCGLRAGVAAKIIRHGDEVMLQSDNVGVLAAMMFKCGAAQRKHADGCHIPQPKRLEASLRKSLGLEEIVQLQRELDLTFVVRHVRGHRPGENRQWVNRLCDRLAKRGRKDRELALRGQQQPPAAREEERGEAPWD